MAPAALRASLTWLRFPGIVGWQESNYLGIGHELTQELKALAPSSTKNRLIFCDIPTWSAEAGD